MNHKFIRKNISKLQNKYHKRFLWLDTVYDYEYEVRLYSGFFSKLIDAYIGEEESEVRWTAIDDEMSLLRIEYILDSFEAYIVTEYLSDTTSYGYVMQRYNVYKKQKCTRVRPVLKARLGVEWLLFAFSPEPW